MLALADLDPTRAEALQDVAPQPEAAEPAVAEPDVAEVANAEISAEGPIPEVAPEAAPDMAADGAAVEPGKTASEQAFGDKPTAQSGQTDGGMFEVEEYQAACTAAGTPEKWDAKYAHGHTAATQWTQPYEGRYDMAF